MTYPTTTTSEILADLERAGVVDPLVLRHVRLSLVLLRRELLAEFEPFGLEPIAEIVRRHLDVDSPVRPS